MHSLSLAASDQPDDNLPNIISVMGLEPQVCSACESHDSGTDSVGMLTKEALERSMSSLFAPERGISHF